MAIYSFTYDTLLVICINMHEGITDTSTNSTQHHSVDLWLKTILCSSRVSVVLSTMKYQPLLAQLNRLIPIVNLLDKDLIGTTDCLITVYI